MVKKVNLNSLGKTYKLLYPAKKQIEDLFKEYSF